MPTIAESDKVLVSGANGYIGCHVVRTLLGSNYAVRGAVRSLEKGRYLSELFKPFGEKFELVIVEDITKDGAFDAAVEGVDAIVHTASPVDLNMHDKDPQEIIGPAVKGTISILQSAVKNGSSVKRVVITSSCAAVLHASPEPKTFSELDWNEQAVKEVEERGINASGLSKYRASKTLAERAAWDLYKTNKHRIKWDLVAINPPFVFGAPIHDTPTPDTLNASLRMWYDAVLIEGFKSEDYLCKQGSCFVHVRVLAAAHMKSLEIEKAGGERIIVSAGPFVWNDWIKVAHSVRPSIPSHFKLAQGYPEFKPQEYLVRYDTAKEASILAIDHTGADVLTRETLNDFGRRGWLTKED